MNIIRSIIGRIGELAAFEKIMKNRGRN